MRTDTGRTKKWAVTLTELLVVLLIIGIISAIGVASYFVISQRSSEMAIAETARSYASELGGVSRLDDNNVRSPDLHASHLAVGGGKSVLDLRNGTAVHLLSGDQTVSTAPRVIYDPMLGHNVWADGFVATDPVDCVVITSESSWARTSLLAGARSPATGKLADAAASDIGCTDSESDTGGSPAPDPDDGAGGAFITTWDTTLGAGTTVTLALDGDVDATIDWGDGTVDTVNTAAAHVHDFGADGTYTVEVTGTVTAYSNDNYGGGFDEQNKLVRVDQWGDLGWEVMYHAFRDAHNLEHVPNNTDGLEQVWDMAGMFRTTYALNSPLDNWDVSGVTDMALMFYSSGFNQPLQGWDVSNVENMYQMFMYNSDFDQPLGNWDVSNVSNMSQMFRHSRYNQDLSTWCVSQFSSEPMGFADGNSSWAEPQPQWGTCP